jgi:hypothetical protein
VLDRDQDHDDYHSQIDIRWKSNVNFGSKTVTAEIWADRYDLLPNPFQVPGGTKTYTITTTDTWQEISNLSLGSEFPHDEYDLAVVLKADGQEVDRYGFYYWLGMPYYDPNDADIEARPLEPLADDPSNSSPVVTSLSDSPDSVVQGATLTLTAVASDPDPGDAVDKVEFYRDSNGNGSLDVGTDSLLGTDTSSSGGWTWSGSTASFPNVRRLSEQMLDSSQDVQVSAIGSSFPVLPVDHVAK